MNPGNIFYEFALLLTVAGLMGMLAFWLKQPLIIAFIIVGILFGPAGLKWVTIGSEIDLLAKIGIALLLFTVGLKLDLHVIRSLGLVSLATGLGQVIFTSAIGYFISLALGLPQMSSLYVSVALTFSSTIIIVKLLSDKREIDSLHGRIAAGFLIVQDLIVVLTMIVLTAFGAGLHSGNWGQSVLMIIFKGTLFLCLVLLCMRFVLPHIFQLAAHSGELLIVLAIAWAVALAAAGDFLGFSKEIGAFLAGVSLASTPYREALSSRLLSLRDFSIISPLLMTSTWSAFRIVLRRWAITKLVRPSMSLSSAFWICASVRVHLRIQDILYPGLGLYIHRTGAVVEDQDLRIDEKRACDGYALSLSPGLVKATI